ncbi:MAG: hypothetical protein ABMB14_00085 [Myxococcota bacterium]
MKTWLAVTVGALGAVAMVGCLPATGDDTLASTVASDTEELARTAESLAAAAELGGAELSMSGEVRGVGDCVWAWSVNGPIAGAAYAADVSAPCGGSVGGERVSIDYQVTAGSIDGTVAADGDGWTFDLTGVREATVAVTTARRGEQTADGRFELTAFTGAVSDETLGAFDLATTYTGWADGVWDLVLSADDEGALDGTLTGPNGGTCAVGGTRDEAVVTCE